jgi:hypothetical protein
MSSKTSSADELRSALSGLFERGEEVFGVFLDEVLHGGRGRQAEANPKKRAAGARATMEGNIEAVLSLLSLPTRSDYKRLLNRVDALQGSLVNISMKLDRLIAAQERAAASTVVKSPRRRATKRKVVRASSP